MKRLGKHNIKHEKPVTSTSHAREVQEHDLAYYIHDRVELMHQVFSVLKSKDLKAMAPECVRRLSIDNLQELCTEELLGISSKRLCAILDGAEPPSDTESSSQSPENMETISLDSISSDEEILSQTSSSKKKKHRHRRQDSNHKSKKRKSQGGPPPEEAERSQASRAGLTVLELLELQARARAIRAQLQKEQANKPADAAASESQRSAPSDNEVEIKEEAPEVVEISSEDEKPDLAELQKANAALSKEADNNGKDSSPNRGTAKKSKEKKKKKEKEKSKKDKRKETDRSKEESSNEKNKSKNDSSSVETDTTENKHISPDKNLGSSKENSQTVTKRINDLIITVPQQHSRKIKLNRNKVVAISVASEENSVAARNSIGSGPASSLSKPPEETVISAVLSAEKPRTKEKSKKKQKKKVVKKSIDKDGSDHDEITLQLSDSEKMDLLEDFDRKHYDNVSSSDSESSSETDSDASIDSTKGIGNDIDQISQNVTFLAENKRKLQENENTDKVKSGANNTKVTETNEEKITKIVESTSKNSKNVDDNTDESLKSSEQFETEVITTVAIQDLKDMEGHISAGNASSVENITISNIDEIPVKEDADPESLKQNNKLKEMLLVNTSNTRDIEDTSVKSLNIEDSEEKSVETTIEITNVEEKAEGSYETANLEEKSAEETSIDLQEKPVENIESCSEIAKENTETLINDKSDLSDGEISERESSEVEAFDLKPEVVCISDEEGYNTSKKKKKKDKKSKKEKKSKKSKSDFRESADENFYKDVETVEIEVVPSTENKPEIILNADAIAVSKDDDDVYEILELSDDSSGCEVEGTVLSKEPTAKEIAALSAKIDEIEREEIITDEQIKDHDRKQSKKELNIDESEENVENLDNISWKDRYLDSKKVKRVLTTSNILNALRKKNKELKKKLEESKKEEVEKEVEKKEEIEVVPVENKELEEGTITHYNTLQGSTKYVYPVPDDTLQMDDAIEENTATENTYESTTESGEKSIEITVTGEMKKDAKQLLKMYKKLLKYNDITKTKQKDPNKKKKKKKKKEKTADSVASV